MYADAAVLPRQTLHFKFLNQLSVVVTQLNMPREHEHSAYNFHSDLFLSGLERIIMVSRPSNYSILHPIPPLYSARLYLSFFRYLLVGLETN